MKTFLTSLVLAAIAALVSFPVDAEEDHARHMLEGYFTVAEALYNDDLEAAQKAASGMVKHDEDSALAESATKIADAEDIATAREAFKTMSAVAIKMAGKHGDENYTVMNCPMVKGGGGDWLSADGKVNNPYFGAKMPHCGGPKS